MINGINSYSSYNYTSTFNNAQNIKSFNVVNDNLNLVSDKSQAINKVLGYGVDKDGFFTSDFNEKAGIPKDYKIYADGLNNFVNNFIKRQPFYSQIDIAKTIGNAYNSFSSFENIADLGSNKYQIHDNKISKGGALIAFFINNLSTIKGQTTLLGKLAGLNSDTDNNEIKEFLSFMNKNPLKYSYEQDGWGNPKKTKKKLLNLYKQKVKAKPTKMIIQEMSF
ncbi:hypothetical protein CUPS4066_03410 [Campylobacter upsaliensis]|nr:hypothetical protein [Campylobacter upsaliensis]MCR2107762.1 hypothetical protein [Campylobacter upsaliensis]